MYSKETLYIDNLELKTYGLSEFKQLRPDTPLAVVFAIPGLGHTQKNVEKLSQAICTLNKRRSSSDVYIIVISIDFPFHGTRKDPLVNVDIPKEGSYSNQRYMLDRSIESHSIPGFITGLIDVFEPYVFGFDNPIRVKKWGIVGFSMGGYSALVTASNDPRISIVVVLSSGYHGQHLIRGTLESFNLEKDYYLPNAVIENYNRRLKNQEHRLKNVNLLLLNGGKDTLFLESDNYSFINEVRKTHRGIEGHHWKAVTIPNNGHYISTAYISHTVAWFSQWMQEVCISFNSRL